MPCSEANTVVLQSHAPGRRQDWLARCCDSVARWAAAQGYDYEFQGDELFAPIAPALRQAYSAQPVILADLGRLLWMAERLAAGYSRVIWCDADVLVFRDFTAPEDTDAFGRECWVQADGGRQRVYRKIHNAWMQFASGSTTLPFYIDRARSLLERARPPLVPQFIGPKLLTAWHNIAPFPVEERAGMASPLVLRDLLAGPGQSLRLLREGHAERLCALNLCASLERPVTDDRGLAAVDYHRVIDSLLDANRDRRL